MAKLKRFLLRHLLSAGKNLISIDDHYLVMQKLLRDHRVEGLIDAGASDGRVTRKLLKAFPDANAYLFEPHPKYREALERYAEQDARVHPQFEILSDQSCQSKLIVCSYAGKTSVLPFNEETAKDSAAAGEQTHELTTASTTIDGWRAANGDPEIQLVKFDIQAGELLALQGATKTLSESTKLIYTEIFFNPMYRDGALLGDIDRFLRDFGFIVYDIYKVKYRNDGALSYANALFVREDIL